MARETSVRAPERLAALERLAIMDTPREPAFDRLTRLAARVLSVPVALVSLVDDHRQWFKSAVGLPEPWASRRETPLSHSFCQHVVAAGAPLLVADAPHDPRVCDNGAVADLGVVAYCGAPLVTRSGQVLGALCVIQDSPRTWTPDEVATVEDIAAVVMTELELRSNAEALRQSQADLEDFFDNAVIGLHWVAGDGTILRVNKAELDLLGYERDEYLGHHIAEFHADAEVIDDILRRLAGHETLRDQPARLRCRDGTIKDVMIDSNVRWDGGRFVHTHCFTRDVTPQRRLQEELDGLFALSRDPLCTLGFDGSIRRVNPAVVEMLGFTPEELGGKPFQQLIHADDRAAALTLLGELVTGRRDVRYTGRFGRKDGSYVWVEWTAAAPTREGFIHCVGRDITERVSLEAERERHREAAEVANRAKSTFLANMSHEIRTPLTSILGYVDLLGDTALPPAEHAAYVEVVRRNGEHLLHVINNVLDLSKIESGKLSIERLAFSPAEMLQEIASLMRVRAVAKGLTLELETSGPVPERIESDPTQFRQILINLVNNAIKFTETGGVRLRLGLAAGAHPDCPQLCVEVIDSGIGISSAMQAQIFEPFMQGDVSMARRFGGTGLGLAISRRLAVLLGGDLHLESTPGQGSTVRVSIDPGPLAGVTMVAQPLAGQASEAAPPAPLPRLDCRVLLAEDGPDNQRLLELFLRRAGAEVEIVENGERAYARAREADATDRPFDVILMDMQMPVLDGHAATAALRRAGYRRPIIALTANAMERDRERCRAAGCDDFLPKPVDRGDLIAKVHQWAAAEGPRSRHDAAPLVSQLNDDDEVVDLVEDFVNVLGQRVSAIELALAARNLHEVAVLAHQLKGAAGLYGFPSITAEAGAVEALATAAAPDPNAARTRLEALAALCRRAVARDPSTAESSR